MKFLFNEEKKEGDKGMKLTLFREGSVLEAESRFRIRCCPNPKCGLSLCFEGATLVNKLSLKTWNDERIGILCCYCNNIVKFFKRTLNDSLYEATSRREMIANKTIYGEEELLLKRIEGLRELGLIS